MKQLLVDRWKDFSPYTVAVMLKSSVASNGNVQSFDEGILRWVEHLRTTLIYASKSLLPIDPQFWFRTS